MTRVPVADTTFLVDVLLGDEDAVATLDRLIDQGRAVWMAAPSLHELAYGAGLHARAKRERARIERLEHAIPCLPFDADAARHAGRFEAEFERRGERPGRMDVQIAAVAFAHGESILTRDERFPRVPGVEIIAY